jgi:hypothetical protein
MAHAIQLHLNGDGCWPDLRTGNFAHGEIVEAGYLVGGTVEGSPTIALRIRLDNGDTVLAETTLRLFMTLAAAFHGKAERDGFHDIWQGPVR